MTPEEIARLAIAVALNEILGGTWSTSTSSRRTVFRPSGKRFSSISLAHHGHFPDSAEELRIPLGNWVYMAPEQVLGVRCDPRSDIYALGGILYELATGRLPPGRRAPAPLSRPIRALVPATPQWLQEVVLRCLEVDARERYASAAEIAVALSAPSRVALTERASRGRRANLWTLAKRRMGVSRFTPAPCPPPSTQPRTIRVVAVAIAPQESSERLREALRDAARAVIAGDPGCRIACITVVPPAVTLSGVGEESSATGRHIRRLVELRSWAKPLDLPEERLTCHVLESDKPAAALVDYLTMNEVQHVLIGAPGGGTGPRRFVGTGAQVVGTAPCTSLSSARGRTTKLYRHVKEDDERFRKQGGAVALCMPAMLLFNYPILALFNVGRAVRGAGPRRHIFIAWAALIIRWPGSRSPRFDEAAPCCTHDHHPHLVRLSGLLFAIAYFADERADAGRSVIAPLRLQLVARGDCMDVLRQRRAAAATGSVPADLHRADADDRALVGRAAQDPAHFETEPHHVARGLHRRVTAERVLGGLVTVIAVIGILPYIVAAEGGVEQLRDSRPVSRISCRLNRRRVDPRGRGAVDGPHLAAFTIAFGTRHLDAAEHHQGMVAAIAFESLVKLLAFLAVGLFVTFGIYDGFGDLFTRGSGAQARATRSKVWPAITRTGRGSPFCR
jgi:hypothetical protein